MSSANKLQSKAATTERVKDTKVSHCNQKGKENTVWFRGHPYLQSVKKCIDCGSTRDCT